MAERERAVHAEVGSYTTMSDGVLNASSLARHDA